MPRRLPHRDGRAEHPLRPAGQRQQDVSTVAEPRRRQFPGVGPRLSPSQLEDRPMTTLPTVTTLCALLLTLLGPPLAAPAADEVPILSTLETKHPVWGLAFAPDGQKLMVW